MKWWLAGVLVFVASAGVVLAQSTNDLFNQAVSAGTIYRSAYSAYVAAKNQHLQYNTAATRLVAIAKTNEVLVKRNEWLIAYLRFIRQTLADVTDIANYPQTVVYLDLENQINQLANLSSLGQGDNFAAINTASMEWEKRLEQIDKLVAAARLQIASTQLANFQSQLVGFATPSASQATTLILIENKLTASIRAREEVDGQLATYTSGYWAKSSLNQKLDQSRSLLLEAAKLLRELSANEK